LEKSSQEKLHEGGFGIQVRFLRHVETGNGKNAVIGYPYQQAYKKNELKS
jgi:hypothetical protein